MRIRQTGWFAAGGLGLLLAIGGLGTAVQLRSHEPVSVSVRENVRVAYDILENEWKEGVSQGLFYVRKMLDAYEQMGVDPAEVHVSAVFHGEAGRMLLRDERHQAAGGPLAGNPNKRLVRDLVTRGVSIELCRQTMNAHGWTEEDVLPEVTIVQGAYPRLIDLQLQGYAYIGGF